MAIIITEITRDRIKLRVGDEDNLIVTGKETVVTAFEGWKGGALRRTTSERLNTDGDFSERGRKSGKVISLRAEATFADEIAAGDFELFLSSVLADGQLGELIVVDDYKEKTFTMKVELNSLEEPVTHGADVEFGWDLYAADPFKYGEPVLAQAEVVETPGVPIFETLAQNFVRVYNPTNALGEVEFKITSAWASPIITEMESGDTVETPSLLVNTNTTFDYRSNPRRLQLLRTSDGAFQGDYTSYLQGAFGTIPAGGSRVFRLTNRDATADSATNDIVMVINVIGQAETYTATFNKGGNPTYQSQIGMSETTVVPGQLSVTNTGSKETTTEIILSGEFPEGFTITNNETGNIIRVDSPIYATEGNPIVISPKTGKMMIGAINKSFMLTFRQWTKIDPGATAIFSLSAPNMTGAKFKARISPKWH